MINFVEIFDLRLCPGVGLVDIVAVQQVCSRIGWKFSFHIDQLQSLLADLVQ